jgi:uncharacterized tellurite resistance protein B-like protein
MIMDKNYHLGLLCFTHLLIGADGVSDQIELDALSSIKSKENIPDFTFKEFEGIKKINSEREIYQHGLDHLSRCTENEKLRVFATLYRLSEVDGRVHSKEIRLLLYSVETAGIEFNDVVDYVKSNPMF